MNILETIQLQIQIIKLQIEKAFLEIQQKEFKKTIPQYKIKGIIFHHGGGDWPFVKVNESHQKKWGMKSSLGFYIGYQWFIEYSGLLYQGRRDNEEGAHTVGPLPHYYNRGWIGVCVQGNTNEKDMTDSQKQEAKKLIDELKNKYNIPNNKIVGHREVSLKPTDCPGKYGWVFLTKNYPNA